MKRNALLLTAVFALLLLAGCDRVTQENYAKIKNGMTLGEVIEILGEPTESSSIGIGPLEATTARWEGKKGTISIQFTGQKVRIKRFLTGEDARQDATPKAK